MRKLPLPLLAVASLASSAWASDTVGVVRSLNDEAVALAIAKGRTEKPARYYLRTQRVWVEFDTPFLRLVRKVADTVAEQQPVAAHLATPDISAPELRLSVGPEPHLDRAPSVKQVFVEQADGSRVAPRASEKIVDHAQSRRGRFALNGLKVVFPIEALRSGARFRVVLSEKPEELVELPPGWFDQPR